MRWRTKDKGKSLELSSPVAVLRATLRGSDKIRLLKESCGTSPSETVEVYVGVVHIPRPEGFQIFLCHLLEEGLGFI